jgi:hypothetical protein
MAKEKVLPLSHKLYFDAAYTAVARAVRYATLPCDELRKKLADAEKELGTPQLDQAARELLDYDHEGKTLVARLKPEARKFCRQLLGPPPEEEDDFWRHPDGTPMERPPKQQLPATTKKPTRKPRPEPAAPLPEPQPPSEEEVLRSMPLPVLAERLHEARWSLQSNGERSWLGMQAKREVSLLEAEYRRRELVIPETPNPVARKRGA